MFFDLNVNLSHFVRQQASALIFLVVIEDIKVYHIEYSKVFALRKNEVLFAKS
jgi:hypothetical protein